jgi:hypothetical protein
MAIGTAAAIIGASVIGAGASVASGNAQSRAARRAGDQAANAANQEIQLQREARDDARRIFTPYSQEGASARRMYNAAMGIGASAGAVAEYEAGFEASPYWRDAQYGSGQAMNALISTNAAMGRGGSVNSGKALRAAQDIQTGYRGQATQNYLSSLAGISDTGLVADSGIASGGQTYANMSGNALRNAASLQGQYGLAGAQAQANGVSNAMGFLGYGMGNLGQGGGSYFRYTPPTALAPLPAYNPAPLSPIANYRGG